MELFRLGTIFLCVTWYACVLGDPKLFCVYGSWAARLSGEGRFQMKNIRTELCDYVIYAYAELSPGGGLIVSGDPSRDLDDVNANTTGAYTKLRELKRQHPHIKTLIALGGHKVPASKFSRVAAIPRIRDGLGIGAAEFTRFHGFDGLALAWFYPGMSNEHDLGNFTEMVRTMSSKLRNYGLELAVFTTPITDELKKGYDLGEIGQLADYILPMTFDYHGPWESKVHHFAPLYGEESTIVNSVNGTINYLLNQSVPAEKIALGIATFGRTFTLEDSTNYVIGSPSIGPGRPGLLLKENGFLGYNELCKEHPFLNIIEETTKTTVEGPYAVEIDQWISFEDQHSIKRKVAYAKKNNLSGVFLWTMDTDDFQNNCRYGTLPLHVAAAQAAGKNVSRIHNP